MQRSLDLFLPELEEGFHLGKVRRQIVLLPDEFLQQRLMVRHPIEDFGGGQSIALEPHFHFVCHGNLVLVVCVNMTMKRQQP
jgi:hypothetical protein